jgi:hypothetical protein
MAFVVPGTGRLGQSLTPHGAEACPLSFRVMDPTPAPAGVEYCKASGVAVVTFAEGSETPPEGNSRTFAAVVLK